MEEDTFSKEACAKLNDRTTALCTHIEREFLRTLEGGCTAPIGALAQEIDEAIRFKGVLFSLDGATKIEVEQVVSTENALGFGTDCALEVLDNGGRALMKEIKSSLKK
jgi:hydroxymethylbilane synthase